MSASPDIAIRDVRRAYRIAECHVLSSIFTPRPSEVRPRSLKMVRMAFALACPSMQDDEVALLMDLRDGEPPIQAAMKQIPFWWSESIVVLMAGVLNQDWVPPRASRVPKPLPADLDATGLPMCGPKRVQVDVEVRRSIAPSRRVRPPQPIRVAAPWDPVEAHQARPAPRQRPLPHHVTGDPGPGRSALDERRRISAQVPA